MLTCVCKMCTRINGAAELVDILHHFSHSVSQLLPCSGVTRSTVSSSVPYVLDISAALINILAFRVSFHMCFLCYFVECIKLLS